MPLSVVSGAASSYDANIIRFSGLAAWYLLISVVVVGTTAAGNVARHSVTLKRKYLIHRVLSRLLYLTVALHVWTIFVASFKGWQLADVTEIGWGTLARNCGVTAAYLLIVVAASNMTRSRYPTQWRIIHHTFPFVILVLATVHGVAAGPDHDRLAIVVPSVVALTVLGMIFAIRSYGTHTKTKFPQKRRYVQ